MRFERTKGEKKSTVSEATNRITHRLITRSMKKRIRARRGPDFDRGRAQRRLWVNTSGSSCSTRDARRPGDGCRARRPPYSRSARFRRPSGAIVFAHTALHKPHLRSRWVSTSNLLVRCVPYAQSMCYEWSSTSTMHTLVVFEHVQVAHATDTSYSFQWAGYNPNALDTLVGAAAKSLMKCGPLSSTSAPLDYIKLVHKRTALTHIRFRLASQPTSNWAASTIADIDSLSARFDPLRLIIVHLIVPLLVLNNLSHTYRCATIFTPIHLSLQAYSIA